MNLEDHYNDLWKKALQKFKKQEFEFDTLINSDDDTRYGITLLARPSNEVKQNISKALQKIKTVAPNQYYYPISDLHITILSIISCYAGFSLDEIDQSEYRQIVHSATKSISPFKLHFRGVTASPSCIMVQGFPEGNQLKVLRNTLRHKFRQSKLQHSIDKRYQLQTAHMTAIRFKESFAKADKFVAAVTDLRNRDFGSCVIDQVELAGNDWYQQKEKVRRIDKFRLDS